MREKDQNGLPMYGAVASLRNAVEAMEELVEFLPDDFIWPTDTDIFPNSVTIGWNQIPLERDGGTILGDGVQLRATPTGVTMHAIFRHEDLDVTSIIEDFKAEVMAELLLKLTKDWSWEVQDGIITVLSIPTAKPLPPYDQE